MHISIFASVGSQNLWDELILKNEIELLEKEYWENIEFTVFTYDLKNPFFNRYNVSYKEYFPIWIRNKKYIWKNIKNFFTLIKVVRKSDLIVLWWGWIMYDNEYQQTKTPLDLWLNRVKIFNFFNKKYIYFRWWINIKNEENLGKLKNIFENAFFIEVRDKYSKDLLGWLWIKSYIKKDPVFYDRWYLIQKKSILWTLSSYKFNKDFLSQFDFKWKKVWLAIRAWYFVPKSKISDRMEEWIIKEIILYLVKQWAHVVLMPHSFHKTDILANDYEFLKRFLVHPAVKLKENMDEVYNVYLTRQIDFCFAMRLHSIILSHVYEIPFVWISYSTKTDEVLKELMSYN